MMKHAEIIGFKMDTNRDVADSECCINSRYGAVTRAIAIPMSERKVHIAESPPQKAKPPDTG